MIGMSDPHNVSFDSKPPRQSICKSSTRPSTRAGPTPSGAVDVVHSLTTAFEIHREAFSRDQLQKLQPFIGAQMDEESFFAATYETCFPFLTTEVKCGATALDIADRQNAVSQTIALRGLVTLFRLVGREQELHRKIVGFSISHDDETVRIIGHYPYIDGKDTTTYHRFSIAKFDFTPTAEGDKWWKTPTFVMNVHDLWASDHFKLSVVIPSSINIFRPLLLLS